MTEALATRYHSPRERIPGVFDALGERIALPGFRGCAFVNASAGRMDRDLGAAARAGAVAALLVDAAIAGW